MKIKQILSRGCIVANLEAKTKEEVLSELAGLVAGNFDGIPLEETIRTLQEREELGSTGIGNGVAIPHGKIASLAHIITAFGRSVPGIAYDSQDGKPAHLFFVLLAPENAASLHLKALARLSRLLKDAQFRNKLLEAKDADEIYQDIIAEDEKF
jgi:PTS system nitrogen regulatory IIA component